MKEYKILTSGNAPLLYPTDAIFGLLWYGDEEAIELPKLLPTSGDWGNALATAYMLREDYPMPSRLSVLWIALTEETVYEYEGKLPYNVMELLWSRQDEKGESMFTHIVVGMAPFGQLAIWCYGLRKSVVVDWKQGKAVRENISDFIPSIPNLHKYCDELITEPSVRDNLQQNGLPPHDLFDNYMKQFTYRYVIRYERWDDGEEKWERYEEDELQPEFDYIEEMLYDGTHDKLHDDGLLKYHEAGKPKKLALAWHIKKSEYTAYFWFEDERIREVFDRFYGAHPDTKTDFIIRIDPEKRKYELALYRYGLKEPYTIPEDAYQILVFKNKFEDYRSENYSQERGAWIW